MLTKTKKKILVVLLALLLLNLSFSFYFLMKEINLKLNILEPAVKLYVNKDNYYSNSSDAIVLSEIVLNKNDQISLYNLNLENKTSLVVPFYLDQSALPTSLRKNYNLSVSIYSNLTNASNIFEVWEAYISSDCGNDTLLTYLNKTGSTYVYKVCGVKKYSDKNESSDYFNTLDFNMTEPKAIVIKVNPFYEGEFNISIKTKIYEIE